MKMRHLNIIKGKVLPLLLVGSITLCVSGCAKKGEVVRSYTSEEITSFDELSDDWSYNGRAIYLERPEDTDSIHYEYLGAENVFDRDRDIVYIQYYYDCYLYTGGLENTNTLIEKETDNYSYQK